MAAGSGIPTPNQRPSLLSNRIDKLDLQRKSQPISEIRVDDQRRDANPTISVINLNHVKQSSVTSQISDFNQSVQRNINYENIMKSTRQKIIQSHMMQSAQKQKPYLLRLSSIFGDHDKSPLGNLKPNQSSIDFGVNVKKKQTVQFKKRPPLGGLSPLDDSQSGKSPQQLAESQISSFRATHGKLPSNPWDSLKHNELSQTNDAQMSEGAPAFQQDNNNQNGNQEFKKEIKLSNMKQVSHKKKRTENLNQASMIEEGQSNADSFSHSTVKIRNEQDPSPAYQQQIDQNESFAPGTVKSQEELAQETSKGEQ